MQQYGISPEIFRENRDLSKFFQILTTSADEDNKVPKIVFLFHSSEFTCKRIFCKVIFHLKKLCNLFNINFRSTCPQFKQIAIPWLRFNGIQRYYYTVLFSMMLCIVSVLVIRALVWLLPISIFLWFCFSLIEDLIAFQYYGNWTKMIGKVEGEDAAGIYANIRDYFYVKFLVLYWIEWGGKDRFKNGGINTRRVAPPWNKCACNI